jgi:hypothetical protein
MEALYNFETLANIYQIIRRHILDDRNLNQPRNQYSLFIDLNK